MPRRRMTSTEMSIRQWRRQNGRVAVFGGSPLTTQRSCGGLVKFFHFTASRTRLGDRLHGIIQLTGHVVHVEVFSTWREKEKTVNRAEQVRLWRRRRRRCGEFSSSSEEMMHSLTCTVHLLNSIHEHLGLGKDSFDLTSELRLFGIVRPQKAEIEFAWFCCNSNNNKNSRTS